MLMKRPAFLAFGAVRMPTARMRRRRAAGGFAMIEVLVTLVILVFGLLGLAGISARINAAEMESYQRVQALLLLQDMADRLNANRKVADCYSNATTGVQVGVGYTGTPACTNPTGNAQGNAQQNAQAVSDLSLWDAALKGSAEVNGTKIGAMIGAVGCVIRLDPTASGLAAADVVYLVTVSWQGLTPTAAPVTAAGRPGPCGKGLYGNEALHRIVTTTIQIGTLTP
ncbi:type IV pilus assembly protein PilV [Variovorax sp. HW608]|uniref:type IV pilus modification protein PilV n=1 Tax=Variovorax sp. HW608 TaxID=1034889 RepID=UPI00081FC684|nr:type IV pilus modification protein PilV [Variovorax sp. HW608]SCK60267.1 type IV pilus assembly protein PilV [Variovorax sp. HW608]